VSPAAGFALSFALTLALLAAAVAAGLRRRRRRHVALVGLTVAALAWTIYEALRLGAAYDLRAAGAMTPVHLTLAKVATGFLVLPAAAGLRLLATGRGRLLHRRLAFAALALIVAAAVTGTLMMLGAEPLPRPR
jgi:hypothetical protein